MSELFALFKRNLPFCVREDDHARRLLDAAENVVTEKRNAAGELIGAAVVHKNNILLLCVDAPYRGQGMGSELLKEAEQKIKAAGYATVTVGAGEDYLLPGVPSGTPVVREDLQPDEAYAGLDDAAVRFFRKRGYENDWDCNCFDMRMELKDFTAVPQCGAAVFRWAEPADKPGVLHCTDEAFDEFTEYYKDDALYTENDRERVLIAERDGEVVGTLLVSFGLEGPGLGSVGCTTVRPDARGKGIATNMVVAGTQKLKEAGLSQAFLGYTYTGLDKMYGVAGYKICCYYFMAKKTL